MKKEDKSIIIAKDSSKPAGKRELLPADICTVVGKGEVLRRKQGRTKVLVVKNNLLRKALEKIEGI